MSAVLVAFGGAKFGNGDGVAGIRKLRAAAAEEETKRLEELQNQQGGRQDQDATQTQTMFTMVNK